MLSTATLAQSAYANATAIAPTARDTEYKAFADITRQLSDHGGTPAAFPRLAEAVYRNQRLWGLLAEDVAANGNALPEPLRAQIFYLAEFTRQHSRKILHEKASAGILVEINTAVMRGLRASGVEA